MCTLSKKFAEKSLRNITRTFSFLTKKDPRVTWLLDEIGNFQNLSETAIMLKKLNNFFLSIPYFVFYLVVVFSGTARLFLGFITISIAIFSIFQER